jgi:hypothetical protein
MEQAAFFPSQSSSSGVWQSSGCGTTWPAQGPKAEPSAAQVAMPPWQVPMPSVPVGPS